MLEVLNHPVVACAVGAVGAGLTRLVQYAVKRKIPKRPGETRSPVVIDVMGLLCGSFAGLILALGLGGGMSPARHDFVAWLELLVAFASTSVLFVAWAANWRMWVTETGIQVRSGFGVTGPLVSWADIAHVRNAWTGDVVFELRNGGAVKVSPQFANVLDAVRAAHAQGATLSRRLAAELQAMKDEEED